MSDYIYTNGRLYSLDELQHHGVKGQKWGVRRYQNPDGSLTEAGKKRQARRDASDDRYRERQLKATTTFWDKHARILDSRGKTEGTMKQINRKTARAESRYEKTGNERHLTRATILKGKAATMEALKKLELEKVKNLTHDQIVKEKIEVGKQIVTDLAMTVGVTAALLPTTGFAYIQARSAQATRSNYRRAND